MTLNFRTVFIACFISLFLTAELQATFSIVACEKDTGKCGVAVATHNLAVGNGVPFAKALVGAGVSQFETNPIHAPIILKALANDANAEDALALALKQDSQFSDGNDTSFRQIGIVSFKGNASAYTGSEAGAYAGHRSEDFVSVQGNGLTSKDVLDDMWKCFQKTKGSLEERLLSALEAGYTTGGQKIGVTSAALLVSTVEGWPVDVDLRVDYAMNTAIADLRKAFNASVARVRLFQARRLKKESEKPQRKKLIEDALMLAPDWDRITLNAAWLAEQTGNTEIAEQSFCRFKEINPTWAEMLSDEIDFTNCK